ncbi:MAG: hypothetical protein QOD72_901 [Acidimicrobiaceae bacterium]|jgi:hypothetical protein|nr:hypothetical protein [Acidimicrobiaceae bacterium]
MDPVVALAQERFAVEPGAEARTTISISNPGTVVEEYHLEVLGDGAGWMTVEPEIVSLFPGIKADVVLVAHPPRVPAPLAGPTPFAVRCRSAVDPEDSTVVEGEVVVGGYLELALSLSPAIARRRKTGKFRATVTNRGNLPDRVRLIGVDPADELRFSIHPTVVDVPGSGKADATVKVKASAMFMKGAPRRQPFDVTIGKLVPAKLGDPEGAKASAVLDQRPVLSGAMTFLLVLVALAVAALAVVAKLNRDSSVVSRAIDAKPVVAELSQVQPAGIAAVVVQWKGVPDAQSYLVEQLAPGGTGGAPVVQQSLTAVGGAVSVSMTGLQPDTQYCFRITAVALGVTSRPSDQMCTKTPVESSFPPPSGLLVTPVADTGTVQITWTPSAPNAQSILLVDGKPQDPVNGAAAQPAVSPGTHCFTVVGVAPDGSQTKPSNQSCLPVSGPATTTTAAAVTVPGSPTTVATSTTQPIPTTTTTIPVAKGWLALVEAIPAADFAQTEPLERAQRRRADFENAGFPVNLAASDELGLKGQRSWMLYEEGFASRDAANTACAAVAASGLITSQCIPFDHTTPG